MTSFFMAWPSHLCCYVWIYLKVMTNFNTHEFVSSQFKFSQKILKAWERFVKFVCFTWCKEDEMTHSRDCVTFRSAPFTLVCLALSIVYNITHPWIESNFITSLLTVTSRKEEFRTKTDNRPFLSSLVPLFQSESKCETFHMKMSSACSFIFMQIKVIFIRIVLHLDALWNRGTRELGNGLFCSIFNYWKKHEYFITPT